MSDELPRQVDLTWLANITFNGRDRPTSTWLPPGQRLVGRRFNDPTQPQWMDDAEWDLRDRALEPPTVVAAQTRLKQILCEGASLAPAIEHHRGER